MTSNENRESTLSYTVYNFSNSDRNLLSSNSYELSTNISRKKYD